jgi:hypothetical protein
VPFSGAPYYLSEVGPECLQSLALCGRRLNNPALNVAVGLLTVDGNDLSVSDWLQMGENCTLISNSASFDADVALLLLEYANIHVSNQTNIELYVLLAYLRSCAGLVYLPVAADFIMC